MKILIAAIALTIALPAVAQQTNNADQAQNKGMDKGCCTDKDKDSKPMKCCAEAMKSGKKMGCCNKDKAQGAPKA